MINLRTYFLPNKSIGPITLKITLDSAIFLVIVELTCSSSYLILQILGPHSALRLSKRPSHIESCVFPRFHGPWSEGRHGWEA